VCVLLGGGGAAVAAMVSLMALHTRHLQGMGAAATVGCVCSACVYVCSASKELMEPFVSTACSQRRCAERVATAVQCKAPGLSITISMPFKCTDRTLRVGQAKAACTVLSNAEQSTVSCRSPAALRTVTLARQSRPCF
jgi:hypothetical protein